MRQCTKAEQPETPSTATGTQTARNRVLFLAAQPFFRWRGSPIRVAYDVTALAESGYAVDLLTLPFGDPIDIPGVTIERVGNPLGFKDIPIGPSPAKLVFDFLIAVRAASLIRCKRYAVIHGIEECGLIAAWLARRCHARTIYEKHSDPASYRSNPLRNLAMRLYALIEQLAVRHADAVIGTGPGLVEQARRMSAHTPCHHIPDIPSSRVEADPEAIESERLEHATGPDTVLATYVGSFAVYQGIDLLFDAIPRAVRRCPSIKFIVIGGSPAQISARRAQLAAMDCEKAAVFTGPLPPDRLPALLAASDILISPRISGANTPLKLLDYLKAGRAIVATDLPANRQILDERSAVFVSPTADDLADGILALATDPDRRNRLGNAGRDRIRGEYNFELFKTGLANVYRQVLS